MFPYNFGVPWGTLPSDFIRQDLLDFTGYYYFCLHFQFPDEIENTKSLREEGAGFSLLGACETIIVDALKA